MANSGNFNTNKYSTQYNGTIGLNLSWSITSQSTADNTSTIHWVLKSNGSMSSGYYVKGGPITVTIGGVTVLNITSRINVHGNGGFTRNGNITITHDENGITINIKIEPSFCMLQPASTGIAARVLVFSVIRNT